MPLKLTRRQYAEMFGPTVGDQVRLADTDLFIEVERDLIAEAAALGLMGTTIPEAHGGAGRDYVSYALAVEAISYASATVAVILTVNNSLVAEPLLAVGTDMQKELWLSRLAKGEAIGSFALSESQAGSDAANQQTTATNTAPMKGAAILLAAHIVHD